MLRDVACVGEFPNLQHVDLSENMLTDSDANSRCLAALSKLPVLLTLDVSYNQLKEVLDYDVNVCSSANSWEEGDNAMGSLLSSANFSNNAISRVRDLSDHQYLLHLDLSSNQIAQITGLEGLKMLSTLNLSSNRIREIEGMTDLPIVELYMDDNELTSIANLESLSRLEKLFMSGNKIKSLQGLKECASLREVDLGNNDISVIRLVKLKGRREGERREREERGREKGNENEYPEWHNQAPRGPRSITSASQLAKTSGETRKIHLEQSS